MKKFYKYHSVEVLQYLGRAYYRAGKYKEAKTIFLKVSTTLMQNLQRLLCNYYNRF
jgi:RNA polymerase-associated protein CTR9